MLAQILFFVGLFFLGIHVLVVAKHIFFGDDDDSVEVDPGHQLFIIALFVSAYISSTLGF